MKKPENYDWDARLLRQIKDSVISNAYEIFDLDAMSEKDQNKIFDDLLIVAIDRDIDISHNRVILKDTCKNFTLYICPIVEKDFDKIVNTDNIPDCITKDFLFFSDDGKIGYQLYFMSADKFADAFIEFMEDICIGYVSAVQEILFDVLHTKFPYPEYKNEDLIKLINKYRNSINENTPINNSDGFIKNFHHSIYDIPVDNHISSSNAWNQKAIMKKCILNRSMYKNHITNEILRDGLNIAKLAPRASILTTMQSLDLIKTYTDPGDTIVDVDCGFSGKMIATLLLGDRKYLGLYQKEQPFGEQLIMENRFMRSWLATNCSKLNQDNIHTVGNLEKFMNDPLIKNDNLVVVSEINNKDLPFFGYGDNAIETIMKSIKAKKYVFITRKTEKFKKYIVKVDEKQTHLYKYTDNLIIIEK